MNYSENKFYYINKNIILPINLRFHFIFLPITHAAQSAKLESKPRGSLIFSVCEPCDYLIWILAITNIHIQSQNTNTNKRIRPTLCTRTSHTIKKIAQHEPHFGLVCLTEFFIDHFFFENRQRTHKSIHTTIHIIHFNTSPGVCSKRMYSFTVQIIL